MVLKAIPGRLARTGATAQMVETAHLALMAEMGAMVRTASADRRANPDQPDRKASQESAGRRASAARRGLKVLRENAVSLGLPEGQAATAQMAATGNNWHQRAPCSSVTRRRANFSAWF